jgi:hypothetical protein
VERACVEEESANLMLVRGIKGREGNKDADGAMDIRREKAENERQPWAIDMDSAIEDIGHEEELTRLPWGW